MLKRKVALAFSVCFLSIGILAFVPAEAPRQDGARLSIALRSVGDRLLRQYGDSVSLVLPIQKIDAATYAIKFEKPFRFSADSLVDLFKQQTASAKIPSRFTVQVRDSDTKLVQYAFEIPCDKIPCLTRKLREKRYEIEVAFVQDTAQSRIWYAAGIPIALLFFVLGRKKAEPQARKNPKSIAIGRYAFFAATQQLVFEGASVSLTSKETSVLAIFASRINEVVPRETLQHEVWENQGVIVGRSLDVFISKLRKKLEQDENVKIANLHGTGYKLIVSPA